MNEGLFHGIEEDIEEIERVMLQQRQWYGHDGTRDRIMLALLGRIAVALEEQNELLAMQNKILRIEL